MLICLIHEAGGAAAPGTQQARGTLLRTAALTIGSAPDQLVQIPHTAVGPRHAILRLGPGGRLQLTVLSSNGVSVNGRRQTKAFLRVNDVVQIGDTIVTVEKRHGDYTCVLRITEPHAADEVQHSEGAAARAQAPRFTMAFWSWTLTLGIAVIFLLVPLGTVVTPSLRKLVRNTPLVPSDSLWSTGPLHATHQSIGNDCTACHLTPFQRVRNEQCEKCHAGVQHHVDIRTADVALFQGQRCANCHFEHKTPATLVLRDQRLCTDCHARIDRLKADAGVENVADFGAAHPELRIAVLTQVGTATAVRWQPQWLDRSAPATFIERSHLRFSHEKHLDPQGVKSPTGERVLHCEDCHRPNASGRQMLPIRMESQCSGCHRLLFDEHDPTSTIPHGDLPTVFRTLREHFSRQYLESGSAPAHDSPGEGLRRPGADARQMTLDEQRRARNWAEGESLKVARELLEKRVCVDCHEVTKLAGNTGFDQWRVAPVRLTENWMPRARFNHAAHLSEACTSCHTSAAGSKRSSDILMPQIARCRECHGGVGDATKLSSDCLMCHRFHLPKRGLFDTATATAAGTSP